MSDLKDYALRSISCLDLTNLNDDCTEIDIEVLCDRAQTEFGPVAAVCVWPKFVKQSARLLKGTGIEIATVVNFPAGSQNIQQVRNDAVQAIDDGATEIDLVIPWTDVLDGHDEVVSPTVASVRSAIGTTTLKAILETGMLEGEEMIVRTSRSAIEGGADFIKTSTGKVPVNATPSAVQAMLGVIKDMKRPVGLKPSGGLKTTKDAAHFLEMADTIMGPDWAKPETFRFGASGVLLDLLATLRDENAPKPQAGY